MKTQHSSCNILVQSSNVGLGSVLPDYARAGVMQVASKYFGNLNIAAVHFNREGGAYRCTVNVQMGALPMMSGEADDRNAYAAFRRALEKVAKQLRRAKRELREDKPQRLDKGTFLYEPEEVGRRANRQSDGDALALRHLIEDASERMPLELEVGSGDGAHRIAAQ
ncbi:HPF/RaiA family ribosome-associated protein [Methylorubrum extorquens]